MEDDNIYNTLVDECHTHNNILNYYNSSNITSYYCCSDLQYNSPEGDLAKYVLTCIIICVGLPLTLVSIYSLYSMVQNDHVAPIYVINLLISDIIQLCCMIVELAEPEDLRIAVMLSYIYYLGVMASVGFMVCVAMERYLVIACPLWYRFRKTIKTSVVVCIVVWSLPLFYLIPCYFWVSFEVAETIYALFLLLPFPLFIFFLVGTLKALSSARSVPSDEKRRIVAILVVVLLIYTLLFLPNIIWSLVEEARNNCVFHHLSFILLQLSPPADLIMYVFMRKGAVDKLLASLCKVNSDEISRSVV